jgi:hypothetical protein
VINVVADSAFGIIDPVRVAEWIGHAASLKSGVPGSKFSFKTKSVQMGYENNW